MKGWVSLVFFRAMAESVVRHSNNNKGAHVIHHHHHHYISRMSPACWCSINCLSPNVCLYKAKMIASSCHSTLGVRRFTGSRSAACQSYVAIRDEGLFDLAFFYTPHDAFLTDFARLCMTVKSCRFSAPGAHSGIRNRSCFAMKQGLRFFVAIFY